jgi:hypothetical protein
LTASLFKKGLSENPWQWRGQAVQFKLFKKGLSENPWQWHGHAAWFKLF